VEFRVNGGGAVFQLGPDVVTNQQVRLGVQSLNTGQLGGETGRLYELRSGNPRDLSSDIQGAGKIVDETIDRVAQLRGRLGALQKATIDSNVASLSELLTNLTEAESSIRDSDFAVETAALTRAQVLTQSGTAVLAISNQSPHNVLSLLR
jgi:flagellin